MDIGNELSLVTWVRKSKEEGTHTPMKAMKQVETDPDLVVSQSLEFVGQILGDTTRQEMGKGQQLMKALVKDRVRRGGEMGRDEGKKERGSLASQCSGYQWSLLTGLTEPATKQRETVKLPDT